MSAPPIRVQGQLALLLVCGATYGSERAASKKAATKNDPQALTKQIDRLVGERWAKANVKPAARADDAEFLRRVYLDLAGRIPTVAETRAFLESAESSKRADLVNQLLSRSGYVNHFTNVWRAILIPEVNNNFLVRVQQNGFEGWLKERIKRNAGYDEMARDLITAEIGQEGLAAFAAGASGAATPIAFYSAKEFRPENLAAGTARVFLGVSVECAQCHDHPFADWNREQFWGFAAFYSGIQSQRVMDFLLPDAEKPMTRELTIPGTETVVKATYLDGSKPKWEKETKTREKLAEWVTSPSNPYFSRAAVNRIWAYFYGTGLVEPVDEMIGESSSASHPELLDVLAKDFAAHDFDTKYLIRAITASRAYQLSSASTDAKHADPTLFARAPLRGMTPEQLFDSVATATGYRDSGNSGNDLISGFLGGNPSARSEFLRKFQSTERAVEAQTSILQALSLMNGRVVADATSLERSETLAAVVDAPFASTEKRIETLYLATLSRKPSKSELERVVKFVKSSVRDAKEKDKAEGRAMADVFWALLNGSEFVLNH